jgi:hypothetical protein
MHHRLIGMLAGATVAAGALVFAASPVAAAQVDVTSGSANRMDVGSFPWAVAQANGDPSIDTIVFTENFDVPLTSEVTYTGAQDLTIDGNGSILRGTGVDPDTDTWDSGLFVSRSDAGLAISELSFVDSFNNGLAVFLPARSSAVEIVLDEVTVDGAQFHGVLVDGQQTTGYNTDGFIHPDCLDPHFVDADANINFVIRDSEILDNGRIDGFDITQAGGCPQDFDGVRVDQGGNGSIFATVEDSSFDGNLADGMEIDETGNGNAEAIVTDSDFNDNGATAPITCTEADCDTVGGEITDLDDAFDIDETGNGDLIANISTSDFSDNSDEGVDLDEAGNGSVIVDIDDITANGNTDEGVKATEEDNGNIAATVRNSNLDGSDDSDNAEFEEFGRGNVVVVFEDTTASNAGDGDGLKVEEEDEGSNRTTLLRSTLDANDDEGLQATETGVGNLDVVIEDSSLQGNADSDVQAEQEDNGTGRLSILNSVAPDVERSGVTLV